MSFHRCIICCTKIEEYDDEMIGNYEPTKKDMRDGEMTREDMDQSSYEWIVCSKCYKKRKGGKK